MVVLLNRGLRTYHLLDGKNKDGSPLKRALPPGGSIETLDEAEAKNLLGYSDIVDAEKAIKPVADKIKELTDERDSLKEQVADLLKKLKKYEKE